MFDLYTELKMVYSVSAALQIRGHPLFTTPQLPGALKNEITQTISKMITLSNTHDLRHSLSQTDSKWSCGKTQALVRRSCEYQDIIGTLFAQYRVTVCRELTSLGCITHSLSQTPHSVDERERSACSPRVRSTAVSDIPGTRVGGSSLFTNHTLFISVD
jgi:hypothetical protein